MNVWPFKLSRPRVIILGAAAVAVFCSAAALAQDTRNKQSEMTLGKTVYMGARCFACHGEYGYGGAGPRFREDRYLGLSSYVIGQILLGRDIMPPFERVLDDRQIAAVASYIRNSWGNTFGDVQPTQVAQIRHDLQSHPSQGGPVPPPASSPGSSGTPK
jgi:mono/diheme cytochrome c family protein